MSDDPVKDLMAELERRVAEKRAAGLYSIDALADRNPSRSEPFHADDLDEIAGLAELTPRLGLAASTRRGAIGKTVGRAKSGLSRATSQPLLDLADQSTAFNTALLAYVIELAQEVADLRTEVVRLRSR